MIDLEQAVQYHYGCFPPQQLEFEKFIEPLLEAQSAISRYDQMLKNMHNSEILLAPLRKQEAVISSRMEGTISTMDEIMQYEADHAEGDEASADVRSEVIETILYQRALKAAQQALEDGDPLSPSLIKTIHQSLLPFGRGAAKSPGKFKTEQNYVGSKSSNKIDFLPISPEKLQDGLDALFDYINTSKNPALVKAGMAHVELEALHPFKDGNGRIGRMLITLMLWRDGLISAPHFYISEYMEENKDLYIGTMRQVSSEGAWNEWCIFFLNAVACQAFRNLEVAEGIRGLYKEMKEVFTRTLSSKYGLLALDFVFTNPVFRNNTFTHKSGIPEATARRFTREMLKHGLIETRQEAAGRRPALYSFEPLMRLVRV